MRREETLEPQDYEELPADGSLADPLPDEPFGLLERWITQARTEAVVPNPTAMALATVASDGRPSVRLVLCRGLDGAAGELVFYTNRESRKGRELGSSAFAAATFHWDPLARQARVEGRVRVVDDAVSDAYFASRPRQSQVAAWASQQSEPLRSRAALLERLREEDARFIGQEVPRPPHWGGYAIVAERVELWVGSAGRAHDRACWERDGSGWRSGRLQP